MQSRRCAPRRKPGQADCLSHTLRLAARHNPGEAASPLSHLATASIWENIRFPCSAAAAPKAGGREYLENYLYPRAIAENVMRRGFTPPEES